MKKSNTCSWCFKSTNISHVFASQVPLLEWMEEKINLYCVKHDMSREELWGDTSDWSELDLEEGWEMELLVYDELVASISQRIVCKECLIQDDNMFKKYYISSEDGFDIEFNDI